MRDDEDDYSVTMVAIAALVGTYGAAVHDVINRYAAEHGEALTYGSDSSYPHRHITADAHAAVRGALKS